MADAGIRTLVKAIQKKLKDGGQVTVMGDAVFAAEPKEWVSTGLTLLDLAIRGGLPVGRMVEIFGGEASGKSLLLLNILAEAQKMGAVCGLIDTEQAHSLDFARKLSRVNVDELIYSDVETLEDMFSAIENTIIEARENFPDRLIVIGADSIAGLPTQAEAELTFDENASMALAARLIKRAMRKLTRIISRERVLVVFTNQEIAVMNAPAWGPKTTTYGGGGMRYHCSVRLQLSSAGKITVPETKALIGNKVRALVYKNRVDPPGKKVDFAIYFDHGIDDVESVCSYLWDHGALGNKKGWVEFDGKQMRMGQLVAKCREDKETWEKAKSKAVAMYRTGTGSDPDAVTEVDGEE